MKFDLTVFEKLISHPQEAGGGSVSISEIGRAMHDALGFDFAGLLLFPSTDLSAVPDKAVSNHPAKWDEHYLEQQFFLIDPTLRRARSELFPFRWGEKKQVARYNREARRIYHEAKEFRLHGGYCVPIHVPDGKFAILAASHSQPDLRRDIDRNAAVYRTTLQYFGSLAYLGLQRHSAENVQFPRRALSPREKECLQFVAEGLEAGQIADRLNIVERTVQFHLANAKKKLSAANLPHAVYLALLQKQI